MNVRPEILTQSGTYFPLLAPESALYGINDIAHALANTCRFGGHTREFYSVAQHSVLVSSIVPPEFALEGLLHDASEAFVGDVALPLKQLLPDYKAIEERIQADISERYGLRFPFPPEVKHADLVALATERRDLMPNEDTWAIIEDIEPLKYGPQPLHPTSAKLMFLDRFDEVMAARGGGL